MRNAGEKLFGAAFGVIIIGGGKAVHRRGEHFVELPPRHIPGNLSKALPQRQVVRQANLQTEKPQFVAPQGRPISLFWFFAAFVA